MPERELVEVDLQLRATHAVMGDDSHCWRLPIARSASGTTGTPGAPAAAVREVPNGGATSSTAMRSH